MRHPASLIAVALILVGTAAHAQRRTESEYGQGLQQSALAFAAQNQWRGADPSNRYIGGRRQAGRLYDEPPYDPGFGYRPAQRRPYYYQR